MALVVAKDGVSGAGRRQAREDCRSSGNTNGTWRQNAVSGLRPMKNTCVMLGYLANNAGQPLATSSVIDASRLPGLVQA